MKAILTATLVVGLGFAPLACAQQTALGERFAVASGHPEATRIGLEVLRRGGNAIDAAAATSLALGVAEPYGSGLGGKLILLYREGRTGKVYSLVALCTSPTAMDAAEFAALSGDQRKYGYRAAGVPGLPAGIHAAHERWGSLPWEELVEPAARLAEKGVEVSAAMRGMFVPKVKYLERDPEAASLYLMDGEAPPVGAKMVNSDLANTLREFGAGGREAFYEGPIAEKIVAAAQRGGSGLSLSDFSAYRPEFGEPLSLEYRSRRVYSCPPPLTGGVTVLATLNCLEAQGESPRDGVGFTDRAGRVLQCLYPRIRDEVADTAGSRAAAERLLSKEFAAEAAEQSRSLDPREPYQRSQELAAPQAEWSIDSLSESSTSHLVVADADGNVVSLTQSLSLHFGASVIAPGTGVLLNDSMSNFATHDPGAVNYAGAGKRARSTIAPVIVTEDGRPWLALGIPGGQRIPTTTLQLLWRVLDRGEPLDEAFAASRFHLRRPLGARQPPNIVDVEEGIPLAWRDGLTAAGWKVVVKPRDGHYFGGGNAVQYREDGRLLAVADPRRTNAAAGE